MQEQHREFKEAVYEQIARVGRAVASPKRLELLDLLCQGEATVERLAEKAGLTMGSASQHLQGLLQARLVRRQRHGTYAVYSLADDDLSCTLLRTLRQVAEDHYFELRHLTESLLTTAGELEPVDMPTLLRRVDGSEVTVVDVRPTEEFLAGHWPGAVSVPLESLAARIGELPTDRLIAAYCRGPYCVLSVQAVDWLNAQGYRTVRLTEGVMEWRAKGLRLASGEG